MVLPAHPVTLSAQEIAELNSKLSRMRHDINNQVALIVAAAELIRLKPHLLDSMVETIATQPVKITDSLARFSEEFERSFGIIRVSKPPGEGH